MIIDDQSGTNVSVNIPTLSANIHNAMECAYFQGIDLGECAFYLTEVQLHENRDLSGIIDKAPDLFVVEEIIICVALPYKRQHI